MSNLIFIIMFLTAFNSLTGVLVFIGILFFLLILYGFAGELIEKNSINRIPNPQKREYVRNHYKKYGELPSHRDEGPQVLFITIIFTILIIGVSIVFFVV